MNQKQLSKISKKLKIYNEKSSNKKNNNIKKILKIIKAILIKNKKNIIRSICKDVNKNFSESSSEFKGSLNIINYVLSNHKSLKKIEKKRKEMITFVPIGVVGIITPWNYPLLTLFERLPFCLASGCPVIVKPSEHTPIFTKLLKKIFNSNKYLSKSLFIINDGNSNLGKKLCNDPNISLICFVGSTEIGRKVLKQCANTLKKTNLELGGKNSAIISNKTNLADSVNKVIRAIFENGGQACVGISRLIIHEKIYNLFLKTIISEIKKQHDKQNLILQPPATKQQRIKVLSTLKYVKTKHKKNIVKVFNIGSKKFTPIFLRYSKNDKYFLENEFFFPIVTLEKYKNIQDCIKRANNTGYGLACYIFSKNKYEIKKYINNIRCGRIWVNSSLKWSPSLPVGGFDLSGGGRDMGSDGFKNYLTSKSVYYG
tara:strand:+ start:1457 stop:2737 length:1281 start_codon:yes stop_codon:yes gene_type:complete